MHSLCAFYFGSRNSHHRGCRRDISNLLPIFAVCLNSLQQLELTIRHEQVIEISGSWLFGDEGTETDSVDLDFMYPIGGSEIAFPLYLRLHKGPMNTLSNYTLEQTTFGFGVKLKPF